MSWFDSPSDLAAIAAVVAALFGVLLYVIKAETGRIARELKPDGGGSLHDLVTEQGDRLGVAIDRIADMRATNDATHETLSRMIERVSDRLDVHAASPAHDRRATDRTTP